MHLSHACDVYTAVLVSVVPLLSGWVFEAMMVLGQPVILVVGWACAPGCSKSHGAHGIGLLCRSKYKDTC